MKNLDDIRFLGEITIGGSRPIVYVNSDMVQWNIAGFNFGDRCFQGVLRPGSNDKREVVIQVLRRDSNGGDRGEYHWIPLETIPFQKNDDTKNKIIRTIKRWGGLNESTSFRIWLEQQTG